MLKNKGKLFLLAVFILLPIRVNASDFDRAVLIEFISDIRGVSEEIIQEMSLELNKVQLVQKEIPPKGREKIVLMYGYLNQILMVYEKFDEGSYTDKEAASLKEASVSISNCLDAVGDNDLWLQQSSPKTEFLYMSLSEVWKIGGSSQQEIINAINKLQ